MITWSQKVLSRKLWKSWKSDSHHCIYSHTITDSCLHISVFAYSWRLCPIKPKTNAHTHPDSFAILEKPNMSSYRALRPKAQVLLISILIHIRILSQLKQRRSSVNPVPYQESKKEFRFVTDYEKKTQTAASTTPVESPIQCAVSPISGL